MTRFAGAFEPVAVAVRSGLEESLHHGAGAALAVDGSLLASVGDSGLVVYPRSCLKPMQAHAMVALGLDLPDDLLAVACASHDGTTMHLDAVRSILASHGLDESALQNTPDSALSDHTSEPSSLRQNCSGKHAAMLATCVVNDWPTLTYLDVDHPLQRAIIDTMRDLGCTVHHVGVDGCGAPTHALALDEVAGAFARLNSTDASVARAMRAHPVMVGGVDSDDSLWMQAVPGLMAKVGAAGMMAMSLADGRAVAFKIADGSGVARQVVIPIALRLLGVDTEHAAPSARDRGIVAVLGHGREVGRIEPLPWTSCSS